MGKHFDYTASLKAASNNRVTMMEKYSGIRVAMKHKCRTHGVFTTTPFNALKRKHPCPECAVKLRETRKPEKVDATIKEIERLGKVKVRGWVDARHTTADRVEYECVGCGNVGVSALHALLRRKVGCRTCANTQVNAQKKRPLDEHLQMVRARLPNVEVLAVRRIKGSKHKEALFVCGGCGNRAVRATRSMLNPRSKGLCAACAPEQTGKTLSKLVGSRTLQQPGFTAMREIKHRPTGLVYRVQGYEPIALQFMTRNLGLDPKLIVPSQKIDPVAYHFNGRDRFYLPDLKYRDTIVEVKSIYTAGLKQHQHDERATFECLKAKARACIKLGYKFTPMIFDKRKNGKCYVARAPSNWLRMTAEQLRASLTFEYIGNY